MQRMITPAQIRQIMSNGMKQHDLAKEVGVTQSTVSRWLSGRSRPDPAQQDILERLLANGGRLAMTTDSTSGTGAPGTPRSSGHDDTRLEQFAERVIRLVLSEIEESATDHEISAWVKSSVLLFGARRAVQDR